MKTRICKLLWCKVFTWEAQLPVLKYVHTFMLEVTKSSLFVSRIEHFRSIISIKGGLGETVNQFPCYWSISVEMNMLKNVFLPAFHDKKFWSIRMWRHQQTEKRACETRRRYVKNVVFIVLMDSLYRVRNIIMYVLSRRTVSVLTRVLFCVYFPRYFATREINTKITLSWALECYLVFISLVASQLGK